MRGEWTSRPQGTTTVQDIRSQAATGLLSRANDETAFLGELAAAYSRCGIGAALDFAAVRRYWQDGTLDSDWRRELARQTLCDGEQDTWRGPEAFSGLLRGVLDGQSPAQGLMLGQRLVVLLAPLVSAAQLHHLLGPATADGMPHLRSDERQLAQAAALADWAAALAGGEGDWAGVAASLRKAGAAIAALPSLFVGAALARWASNDGETRGALRVLVQLQLATLLQREHTIANAGVITPEWALGLLIDLTRGCYLELRGPAAGDDAQDLVAALLRPLARAAAASPRLLELAAREDSPVGDALSRTGLASALAEDAARWKRFLETISERQLRSLWLTSTRFATRHPAQALQLDQTKWQRCGQFSANLESAEAIAWYASLLDALSDEQAFAAAFRRVFDAAGAARRRELIARHLETGSRGVHYELLDQESDAPILAGYAHSGNTHLSEVAIRRLFRLAIPRDDDADDRPTSPLPCEPYWSALRALEPTHADALVEQTVDEYGFDGDSPARWESLWEHSRNAPSRNAIARSCLRGIAHGAGGALLSLAESLYRRAPEIFRAEVADDYFPTAGFNAAIAATVSPLRELVASASAAYLSRSSWFGDVPDPLPAEPVAVALAAYPESFTALEDKHRAKLLPLFDAGSVVACAATLADLCGAPGKVLRASLIELIARVPFAALVQSGLLELRERKARLLVLTGLAKNTDPAALEAIAATMADAAHDAFSRDLALDALARAGHPVEALDPWAAATLESLQAMAEKAKIPAAVTKVWNDEAAAVLAPLGEALGRYLLAILLDADGVLPRRARRILAFLPAAQRSDFAAFGVRTWIAGNGSDALGWLLPPLVEHGDERIANDLVRAVKAWMKTRKPKASAAIHLLARLPGNYGIAQVRELWESRKFSESIQRNARIALTDAAQRRGMTLHEFLEQLVPDFGLDRDGLRLDVGPYAYFARVRGDFSVVVVDADGKTTKTLPRARAGEDAERRGVAENQLKALAKNLKPVFKQQSQRLLRNLQTGKTWPVAQWRRLFVEHPLLGVLSQSVVWSCVDADGASTLRFRPNGSGGSVDANDDDVVTGDDARVRVAHPLDMAADERRAWKAQFGDYELISPLAQFDIPVFTADPRELDAEDVARADGVTLNRARFGSLVEKWGYLKGAGEDGAMINEHTWRPDSEWHVTLSHSGISVFFDVDETVTVERIQARRRGADGRFETLPLRALPPTLRATLLAQAEALKALAK